MLFEEFLIQKKLANEDQIDEALDYQIKSRPTFGRLAANAGYISRKDSLMVLSRQTQSKKRYGEICLELGLLTQEQIDEIMDHQRQETKPVGLILVENGVLTKEQLNKALREFSLLRVS